MAPIALAGRLSTDLLDAREDGLVERRRWEFSNRANAIAARLDPTRVDLVLAVLLSSIARSLAVSLDELFGDGWGARVMDIERAAILDDVGGGESAIEYADPEWEQLLREAEEPVPVADWPVNLEPAAIRPKRRHRGGFRCGDTPINGSGGEQASQRGGADRSSLTSPGE
jgi:hypothetical protein